MTPTSLPAPWWRFDPGHARFALYHGDCHEILAAFPEHSVDAVATDPPYLLSFLGAAWDQPSMDVRTPSAHDAERTARGSGKTSALFTRNAPESNVGDGEAMQAWHLRWARAVLRVLKPGGYLAAFGGPRTAHRLACAIEDAGFELRDQLLWLYGTGQPKSTDLSKAFDRRAGATRPVIGRYTPPGMKGPWRLRRAADRRTVPIFASSRNTLDLTAPATELAAKWEGWGTGLKPAYEPILLCRAPLSERTLAANVERWGTGALNINASRISSAAAPRADTHAIAPLFDVGPEPAAAEPQGRWPANVLLDPDAAILLDRQAGSPARDGLDPLSRFFYVDKPDRAERGAGNSHPTLKPVSLMRYLCRLVTPPGGTILDLFLGSGTTALAASAEGFSCLGIEQELGYLEIAKRRIEAAHAQISLPLR